MLIDYKYMMHKTIQCDNCNTSFVYCYIPIDVDWSIIYNMDFCIIDCPYCDGVYLKKWN